MGFGQQGGGSFGEPVPLPPSTPGRTPFPGDLISFEDCYLDYKRTGKFTFHLSFELDPQTYKGTCTLRQLMKYRLQRKKECRPRGLAQTEDISISFQPTTPVDKHGRPVGNGTGEIDVEIGPPATGVGPQPPGPKPSSVLKINVGFIFNFHVTGNNCYCKPCQDIILIDPDGGETVIDADCELPESEFNPGRDIQFEGVATTNVGFVPAGFNHAHLDPRSFGVRQTDTGGYELCNTGAGLGYNRLMQFAMHEFGSMVTSQQDTCSCKLKDLFDDRSDLKKKMENQLENSMNQQGQGKKPCGVWGPNAPIPGG
tara:strand:+ start:2991 stop:3926 length:936 start_codon:yes stop_codon:yes gene_type:complete